MTPEERKELTDLILEEMEYESTFGCVSTEWVLATLVGVNEKIYKG